MTNPVKSILVLSRRDPVEAMRVAAGLTIFGHHISLVFAGDPLTTEQMESDVSELLELAEIEPQTTCPQMEEYLDLLNAEDFTKILANCDGVITL